MSQQPVQIFVSYAWKDNTLPPDDPSAKKGFVTALCEQLEYEFDAYTPAPVLWRDHKNIDPAEQHDPIIEKQVKNSSLLLVVLSNNWMTSAYCRRELNMFRQQWSNESDFEFGHRIILVHKAPVPKAAQADILPNQLGFEFYSLSERDNIAIPFWHRGRGEQRFFDKTIDLGKILAKRANAVVGRRPVTPPSTRLPPDAPIVYLAKPGADMRQEYLRLYKELSEQKYHVVPALAMELPRDASAIQIVDEALKSAVASIHLLGNSMGRILETKESVVAMQLTRAEQAVAAAGSTAPGTDRLIPRLIWMPERFDDADGNSVERHPVDAFAALGTLRNSDLDTLRHKSIEEFVVSVQDWLRQIQRPTKPSEPISVKEKVYLCHAETDSLYAAKIAGILRQGNIRYVMSAYFNVDDNEQKQHHRKKLSECGTVVMCWANASEGWATSLADELEDWQALGRVKGFTARALIAGPPPHLRKDSELLNSLFPKHEIDHVLDFTKIEPSLDALIKIFSVAASPTQ